MDKVLAELLVELGGIEVDGEGFYHILADVAKEADLLYLECKWRPLALGRILRLDAEALGNLSFYEQMLVQLHILHIALVILAEQGEFVCAAVVLQRDPGARRTGAGGNLLDIGYDARYGRLKGFPGLFLLVYLLRQIRQLAVCEGLDLEGIAVEGMG